MFKCSIIAMALLTSYAMAAFEKNNGRRSLLCPSRYYEKSGTCFPCTNCQSQGLEVLSPCSPLRDEICRNPVYGRAKMYGPSRNRLRTTLGPTHKVREKVLRTSSSSDKIERLRSTYYYRKTDDDDIIDGQIKYEENDDDARAIDNLHQDLKAIEQELLNETSRGEEEKTLENSPPVSTKETPPRRRKPLRESRRRKKKKNGLKVMKTPLPTTTTPANFVEEPIQAEVFGQLISETSSEPKIKPLGDVGVIKQVLYRESRQNHTSRRNGSSSSLLRPSGKVFGVSSRAWIFVGSLLVSATLIVIVITLGLRKAYNRGRSFKLLDSRGSSSSNQPSSGSSSPPLDVQSLVSSRTSSFHRSTDSRLTLTSTLPTTANSSYPSSPNGVRTKVETHSDFGTTSAPTTATYVDRFGRTSTRVAARELPV